MSSLISYNGSPLVTINDGSLVTLATQGTYVPSNIVITDTTDVSDALDAIENKGVTIPSGAGRSDLATLIGQIQQNGSGITIIDTEDAAGGIHRQINAVELTGDTVTAEKLASGATAHNALGQAITGTAAIMDLSSDLCWMGANPEHIATIYQQQVTLSDTDFNGWTPSTTAKTIIASSALTSQSIDLVNYEYWLVWRWDYVPTFTSGATLKAQVNRECGTIFQNIYRRPYGLANFATMTDSYNYCTNVSVGSMHCIYYNTSGTLTWTTNIGYGIFSGATAATFGSTANTSTTLIPKTPIISARCSNTYLATARAAEIDQENSTVTITGDLYRVKQGSSLARFMYRDALHTYNNPLTI